MERTRYRIEAGRNGLLAIADPNGSWEYHADAQATIAALQAQVQELEGITKVICGHCCEPMEIPSKAVLQSQLTQRTAELERVRDQFADLRKMVAALPKVEGEILEQGDFAFVRYAHVDGPLPEIPRCNQIALYKHRQGMEG